MDDVAHPFVNWFLLYGGFALFGFLALGILGLPIPDESLLVIAGWLVSQEKLNPYSTIVASVAGSICGISLSYFLGCTAGHYLVKRYGHLVGLSRFKIKRAEKWYAWAGRWTLFIGYFIPVVRHLTGYVAGTTQLKFKDFALFAYAGAIFWSLTFLTLGYIFGQKVISYLY